MDDFKIIVRLLAAIRASETERTFNPALVDEKVLRTTAAKRDNLAIKLQKAGYVDGLITTEDIDNAPLEVLWNLSKPEVTLSGLEYLQENKAVKKAGQEIKNAGISFASQTIASIVNGWFS